MIPLRMTFSLYKGAVLAERDPYAWLFLLYKGTFQAEQQDLLLLVNSPAFKVSTLNSIFRTVQCSTNAQYLHEVRQSKSMDCHSSVDK